MQRRNAETTWISKKEVVRKMEPWLLLFQTICQYQEFFQVNSVMAGSLCTKVTPGIGAQVKTHGKGGIGTTQKPLHKGTQCLAV